jgi:acyl carrier protein
MPDPNQVREAARQVVAEMTGKKLKDGDSLISSGLIDSLSILKLISRLESRLSVSIPPDNLQPDDFENVDYIVDTVLRVASEP